MSRLIFNRRPMPIIPDLRPIYKISQLLLVLQCASRGKKSSFVKMQLMNWSFKEEKRRSLIIESVRLKRLVSGVWGMDPAVNFALQYAVAEHLVEQSGPTYKIKEKGSNYIVNVIESGFMEKDYLYLKRLGSGVTEGMVRDAVEGWK